MRRGIASKPPRGCACRTHAHYSIEIEHYLLKLLDAPEGDFLPILRRFAGSGSKLKLTADLNRSIDRLKSGNARTPSLSPSLVKMLTEAWTVGSLSFGAGKVRTGHTILALVVNDECRGKVNDSSREFQKIDASGSRKRIRRDHRGLA